MPFSDLNGKVKHYLNIGFTQKPILIEPDFSVKQYKEVKKVHKIKYKMFFLFGEGFVTVRKLSNVKLPLHRLSYLIS